MKKLGLCAAALLLVLTTGCSSNSTSSSNYLDSIDEPVSDSSGPEYDGLPLLDRLKLYANDSWAYDPIGENSGASPIAVYSTSECSVWVFDSVATIEALNNQDFFADYAASQWWWGEDGYSSEAVILLPSDPYRPCSKAAVLAFNWTGLADIENLNLVGADLPFGQRGTSSYQYGYDASAGASAALLINSGGVTAYCEDLLAMHNDWSAQDKADYVLGCQDRYS